MKFELNQTVYYLMDSRVHSAPVVSRMVVENAHDDWSHTPEQKRAWQRHGPSRVSYVTVHGEIAEDKLFASKKELIASI
jgi:hypothetical protein